MHGTISHEHPQEVTPDLGLHTDPAEIEEEEQAAAEKVVTKEAFQCEWTAPAPEFTAAQPEMVHGVQVPWVPTQQVPPEDWSLRPGTEDGSDAPSAQEREGRPLSAFKPLSHRL